MRKAEQPKLDRTHRRNRVRKSRRSVILQTDECVFLKINAYICGTRPEPPDEDGDRLRIPPHRAAVPLDENGKITDDTRIRGALPTLKKVLADGGSLVIMSHMGKPKGKVNPKFSLSQIVDAVSEKLGVPVKFAPDCAKAAEAAAALKPGEALMLENLRFYPEEEGKPVGIEKEDPAYEEAKKAMKASQKEFAKTLASYADCYINDAFGTAHRKHASTAVIADYFDAGN